MNGIVESYRVLRPVYHILAYKNPITGEHLWNVKFQQTDLSVAADSPAGAIARAKQLGVINPVLLKENT